MPRPHTIHPAAHRELARAERWYRREATIRVADALLTAFESAVARACAAPESGMVVAVRRRITFRAVRLRPFRYRLIYFVRDDGVRVLAVPHDRRRPEYWLWRLSR